MTRSKAHFHWQERTAASRFRTGVSLHSHTLHSRESLDFIGRATRSTPWLGGAIRKQQAVYRARNGRDLDLKRAWWTPPLSALQAWNLEKRQIETTLDLNPLVSLSDHDSIEAGQHLQVLEETRDCPISVEWTAPFRQTFFHIGLHNLLPQQAGEMMRSFAEFTASPEESRIAPLLEWAASNPETLAVLNHPMWDENHIGPAAHREHLKALLEIARPFIHAFELNGLRPWKENQETAALAAALEAPMISGGDRHGFEPNACINLTNANSFPEFVDEIRREKTSDVLFMPQYREPLKMRIIQNMCAILEDDPAHALGWTRWSDRVFYLTDAGVEKSLSELWGGGAPRVVNRFVGLVSLARHKPVQSALRRALMDNQEFAL